MSATPDRGEAEVENFARVFVKRVDQVPADAQAYYDPRNGVYFKLHLDHVSTEEAEPLLAKARERFDLELVRRVTKGDVYKERVYIDHPSESPEGYKVHTGPNGGLYYETGLQQVGVNGGETRNVALIHWDDVEIGDDIVFEADSGEQFAEITDIDERPDAADVIHVETDDGVERALPGTYTVDVAPEEKSEGTMTSGTDGAHNARYSPEDDEEEPDLPLVGEVNKRWISKEWVGYTGPQGGQGWRNTQTGEIRYQEESPAVEEGGGEEPGEAGQRDPATGDRGEPSDPPDGGYAEGWDEPPDSPIDFKPGQRVEAWSEDRYFSGSVSEVTAGTVTVDTGDGEFVAGSEGPAEITAVEEEPFATNANFDPARFRHDEEALDLAMAVNNGPNEGFTLHRNLEPADVFDRDVWLVSITAESHTKTEGVQPDDIIDFYEEYYDLLEDESALHVGGWSFEEGTDQIDIDLTVAVEDEDEALALGDRFNQDAIANMYRGEFPETGGEGGDQDLSQDEIEEILSGVDSLAKHVALRKGAIAALNPDATYRGTDSGVTYSGRQLGYIGWKGDKEVSVDGDRVTVDGEEFVRGADDAETSDVSKTQEAWVSFVGPEGGQGWVNLRTGEKRYQAARPGEGAEGYEEEGLAEGWDEPPEDLTDLLEGQRVEAEYDDEYHQAEVVDIEDGVPMLDDDSTDIPYSALDDEVEVTAVEELGHKHPATEMVSLDPGGAATWAQDYRLGDEIWIDSSNIGVVDEPAYPMQVMGYVDEGYSQGELAVKPTQPFLDEKPDADHLAISEDDLLSPEEADERLDVYRRMEDFGWEVGDRVFFRDTVTGDLHDAEVLDPIEGQIAFETDEGARYFPQNDEHMEMIEPDEYAYDPADFGWDEEWEMGEVEPGGAVWSESMGAPYRVASAPHSDDEHIAVYTEDGNEWLPIDDIPVYSPNSQTPPEKLGWYSLEVPDAAFEDEESEGPDDTASGYDPTADQIPSQGPHTGDYEGYDTDGIDGGDWTPLTEVSDETVDEGDHVMVVTDYDHKDGKEAYIGEAYRGDTDWKIDVHNHDQPDWNLGKPVNGNDVEAYIATPHAAEGASDGTDDAADTTTPSEDDAASAVAEPADEATDHNAAIDDELDEVMPSSVEPAEYTPEAAEEFRDMSDIGANHGNSVAAMEVAVLPDGSKMVHKDISHHTVEVGDIKREMVGYEAAKLFDDNVPVHTADIDDGWAASEVAPGVDAKDATPEMQQAVDETDFHEMAAGQLIVGNTDLHQNNVRVDEDGRLYPFDLDRAGGDLQGEWVGNLTQYEDTLDRAFGEMEKAATALGVQMDRDAILQRAQQKAENVEIETDLSAAADWDVDLTDVIADNIEALRNGEVTL